MSQHLWKQVRTVPLIAYGLLMLFIVLILLSLSLWLASGRHGVYRMGAGPSIDGNGVTWGSMINPDGVAFGAGQSPDGG
jgi:hypothetical protein